MRTQVDAEREKSWRLIEEIGRRNAHIDPDEAERDIAQAIAEVREEARLTSENESGS